MTPPPIKSRSKSKWVLAAAGAASMIALVVIVIMQRDAGPLEVPLGVEHAVAVTYAGPELVVKPFSYGAAVSLRIASVKEHNGRRTYDIRYMLNRGGTHNITDYLTTATGVDPVGLPDFPVRGLEALSQGVDKRIQELTEVKIGIWHYYYETMAAVIALWLLWLALIIFWPRRRDPEQDTAADLPDPFPARLNAYLAMAAKGTLSETDKARMEMMLIDHWCTCLPHASPSMHTALRRIGQDPSLGAAYHTLIDWLHNPASAVSTEQLVERLAPFARTDAQGGAA